MHVPREAPAPHQIRALLMQVRRSACLSNIHNELCNLVAKFARVGSTLDQFFLMPEMRFLPFFHATLANCKRTGMDGRPLFNLSAQGAVPTSRIGFGVTAPNAPSHVATWMSAPVIVRARRTQGILNNIELTGCSIT